MLIESEELKPLIDIKIKEFTYVEYSPVGRTVVSILNFILNEITKLEQVQTSAKPGNKMTRCDFCNGTGANYIDANGVNHGSYNYSYDTTLARTTCSECKGSGEQKYERD